MHAGSTRSALSLYFSEIRSMAPPSREREQQLAQDLARGTAESVNRMVESNLAFVAKVANEYRFRGVPLEDLLNEGNVGLIEAAKRFDVSRGTKFITYATWWVRKAILRALVEQSSVVRVPSVQRRQLHLYRRAEESLKQALRRKPTRDEISGEMAMSLVRLDRVLLRGPIETSLDHGTRDEGDRPLSERLADENCGSPDRQILRRETTLALVEAFRRLDGREKHIVVLRFGLGGEPPQSLQAIGQRIGLSRERVRQIECRALSRMRRRMRTRGQT